MTSCPDTGRAVSVFVSGYDFSHVDQAVATVPGRGAACCARTLACIAPCPNGNPRPSTLFVVVKAVGLKLTVEAA